MVTALTHDRQWYQSLLEGLYDSLTGLSTVGYRWHASDRWTRSRAPQSEDEPVAHLEAWIDLGNPTLDTGTHLTHDARIVYAVRYQFDDDGQSQGIMHASISAVAGMLLSYAHGEVRTRFRSAEIEAASDMWLVVTISFDLSYPWRT